MKVAVLLLPMLALSPFGFGQAGSPVGSAPPTSAIAQTEEAPAMTKSEIAAVARFQSDIVTHMLGVSVRIDGVIPRAIRAGNPLQLINPFAPREYGSAFDNVTTDPQSGQANGIRFLGIKF